MRLDGIRKVWTLLLPAERRAALVLLALMLVGMGLETLGVGLVIPALALLTQDDIATQFPSAAPLLAWLGDPSPRALAVGGLAVLVGVYLVKSLFLAFLAWSQSRFAFGLLERISRDLFRRYVHQPYAFHLQRNSAQLIRNVTTETTQFTSNGILAGLMLLTELSIVLGLGLMLVVLEPVATVIVSSLLGAAGWGFHELTSRRIDRIGEARHHHEGLRIQHLQQGLGGIKEIKLLGREADFVDRYGVHNTEAALAARTRQTLLQLPRQWLELLAVLAIVALVLVMLGQGRAAASVLPTLGLFVAAAFRLLPSMNRLIGALQSLKYGLPAVDALHAELTRLPSDVDRRRAPPEPFHGPLSLHSVSYTYPGASRPTLEGVSLSIARGEFVGLVGESGAGKSTLVDLLLGLLPPTEGQVRVEGADIQGDLRRWQDRIGYVPQTIFLTDDSLRRNVAFGVPDDEIDEGALARALRDAQLEEFVRGLSGGVESRVGEHGVRLSGGQRQRIGIARALYNDPAVLVLDEATSALDTLTEREVLQAVTALRATKTILIVAHRPSTVQACDRLYRLVQGRLGRPASPPHAVDVGTRSASNPSR